jgi:GT2 family glycosyltransferase
MGVPVTAVVPIWNRRDLAPKVLATLAAQQTRPERVIAVDNGSTDGAAECAEQLGASVIRLGRNAGFAAAVNRGIAETRTEWALVVNNDVELAPDYLEVLLRAAQQDEAWFATGRILRASRPDTIDGTFDVLCRGGCSWRAGHGEPDGPAFGERRRIYSAPWTAALFRRALFDRAGLLDERFGSYLEDADFGARCAARELAGIYVPEARAWHQGSATLGAWSPAMVRLMARNQVWMAARHLERRDAWHILVAQLLWGLLAIRRGAGRAWLCGKWEGIRKPVPAGSTHSPEQRKALRAWLAGNERVVRGQRSSYWRVYSLLTPGEAM